MSIRRTLKRRLYTRDINLAHFSDLAFGVKAAADWTDNRSKNVLDFRDFTVL